MKSPASVSLAEIEGNRFVSLLGLLEEKLRDGRPAFELRALLEDVQDLAANSDGANARMEESDGLALKFDAVVAAAKEALA